MFRKSHCETSICISDLIPQIQLVSDVLLISVDTHHIVPVNEMETGP